MIKVYIKVDNKVYVLPVTPSELKQIRKPLYSSVNVMGSGETSVFSGKGLMTIELNSFFPSVSNIYSFSCVSHSSTANDYDEMFKKFADEGKVIKVSISELHIYHDFIIESYESGIGDGTKDIYYILSLKEHRSLKTKKISSPNNSGNIYKVKKNDSLYSIAKSQLGNGDYWPRLRDNNMKKYPSLQTSNIIYPGWELIIP